MRKIGAKYESVCSPVRSNSYKQAVTQVSDDFKTVQTYVKNDGNVAPPRRSILKAKSNKKISKKQVNYESSFDETDNSSICTYISTDQSSSSSSVSRKKPKKNFYIIKFPILKEAVQPISEEPVEFIKEIPIYVKRTQEIEQLYCKVPKGTFKTSVYDTNKDYEIETNKKKPNISKITLMSIIGTLVGLTLTLSGVLSYYVVTNSSGLKGNCKMLPGTNCPSPINCECPPIKGQNNLLVPNGIIFDLDGTDNYTSTYLPTTTLPLDTLDTTSSTIISLLLDDSTTNIPTTTIPLDITNSIIMSVLLDNSITPLDPISSTTTELIEINNKTAVRSDASNYFTCNETKDDLHVMRFLDGSKVTKISMSDPMYDFRQVTFMKNGPGFNYYIANFKNDSIMVFDENATYVTQSHLNGASGVQAVDEDLYACSITKSVLYKMDASFNVHITVSACSINPCLSFPKSIVYDKCSNRIYVIGNHIIYIFDRNLTLVDSIDMSKYAIIDITAIKIHNNKIYLASDGKIMTIVNKTITDVHKNICSYSNAWIYSLYFLNDDYMLVSCMVNYIYLFYHNGVSTGSKIDIYKPYYMDIDPLGRLIVTRVHYGLSILF